MKKVEIYCWSSNDGEYLYEGNLFEEELLKEFESCGKSDFRKKEKWYISLYEHLKTADGEMHKQYILDRIVIDKMSLDYEFAEKLNLFDIVDVDCFTADGELGEAIFNLCISAELRFIVARKIYTGKETMQIDFEVCNIESENDCHKALITQTIKC